MSIVHQVIPNSQPKQPTFVEQVIFGSRWLQAPMYFGLALVQLIFVYKFAAELWHLFTGITTLTETDVLLTVLGLIDIVMIGNLLLMVMVGGYETFISRLHLDNHPDRPDWLDHVDVGVLKGKLASSLITISSIHLLKAFIGANTADLQATIIQISIHIVFLLSVLALVWADRLMKAPQGHSS